MGAQAGGNQPGFLEGYQAAVFPDCFENFIHEKVAAVHHSASQRDHIRGKKRYQVCKSQAQVAGFLRHRLAGRCLAAFSRLADGQGAGQPGAAPPKPVRWPGSPSSHVRRKNTTGRMGR